MTPPFFSLDAWNMVANWVTPADVPRVYGWVYLDMVVHELGHCSMSLALGGRMIGVRFGSPVLMSFRGKLVRRVMFGLTPYGGASIQADRPALSRPAQWLVTLGGPTASAVLALIAIGAYHLSPSPTTWLMCYFSAISVLGGFLFPLPANSDARKIWRGILQFIRRTSSH